MKELLIIALVLIACIGLGVLLGWSFWGSDAKYYKNLAEVYKDKLTSPEVKNAILEKRAKDVLNKFQEKHKHYNRSIVIADYDD